MVGQYLEASKELEEKSQKFDSLKLRYTEKVSQLEFACSDKDVHIKLLEEGFAAHKEGIPSFVRVVLNSPDFGNVNTALQTAAI
ncbi:unnamed protein product [Lactuca virosa]|uniref:Uncharacterized protein n=1 Tax=Lactuca virosa TaxID=75947 RepID=A0AAU9PPT2_9ASTR|nr:unnamed protein product [Lactuca virosa]